MSYTVPAFKSKNWRTQMANLFDQIFADYQSAGSGTAKMRVGTAAERVAYTTVYNGLGWNDSDDDYAYKYRAAAGGWVRTGAPINDFGATLVGAGSATTMFSVLGVTAFWQTVLGYSTATTVRAALGATTVGDAVFSAADAATARSALDIYSKSETYSASEVDTLVAAAFPVGCSIDFSGETLPTGFLEEDGAIISRTTYANLFAKIGTIYGVGDGSTTFQLPDSRGLFTRAWAHGQSTDPDRASRTNRGDGTTGDYVGTKQADAYKAHTHGHAGSINLASGSNYYALGTTTDSITGSSGGNETRPSNIGKMRIIKY